MFSKSAKRQLKVTRFTDAHKHHILEIKLGADCTSIFRATVKVANDAGNDNDNTNDNKVLQAESGEEV